MEFCENGDLFEYLKSKSSMRFSEDLVRDYFIQMLNSLIGLHHNGIAHMDIKLENFVLTKEFDMKLIDFGLSRTLKTVNNKRIGTSNYMAPEIVRTKYNYDRDDKTYTYTGEKSDVFSLGVVLFIMAFKNVPF